MWREFFSVIFSVLLFFSCTVENNKTSSEIFKADAESLIQYEVPEWYGRWMYSVDTGPRRDFVAELQKAVKARGLKIGVSNHSAWNGHFFQFNHANGFDASDPSTQTLYGRGGVDSLDIAAWWERTTELAEKYQPDLYYFDWGWNIPPFSEQDPLNFCALVASRMSKACT